MTTNTEHIAAEKLGEKYYSVTSTRRPRKFRVVFTDGVIVDTLDYSAPLARENALKWYSRDIVKTNYIHSNDSKIVRVLELET